MSLGRDLTDPRWMYLKAALFCLILTVGSGLLLLDSPTWRTALLLVLVIWSAARLYYFAFYVIERYIDPGFRFSGIGSAVRFLLSRREP